MSHQQPQPHQISDPHIGTLIALAHERADSIGGESGALVKAGANKCAVVLQQYIDQLHKLANDPRLQEPAAQQKAEAAP